MAFKKLKQHLRINVIFRFYNTIQQDAQSRFLQQVLSLVKLRHLHHSSGGRFWSWKAVCLTYSSTPSFLWPCPQDFFFLQILSEIGFNPGLVCPKSGFYWSPSHRCFVPARLFHLFWLLLGRYMAPLRFSGLSHYPVYYFYFFIISHNKIPSWELNSKVGIDSKSSSSLAALMTAKAGGSTTRPLIVPLKFNEVIL